MLGDGTRRGAIVAVALTTVAVLAPYAGVISGRSIPIPDDIFASDLADGEFPVRVEAARLASRGEDASWTPGIALGSPLVLDPVTTPIYRVLPPAAALGMTIALYLVAATLGTFAFARRVGASPLGAALAGFCFAWSGFFVCQLRHLGVLGAVSLFPAGLCFVDALITSVAGESRGRTSRTAVAAGALAITMGLQWLATFPQSVYIATLAYGVWALVRLLSTPAPDGTAKLALRAVPWFGLAVVLGAAIGARVLLPLRALAATSDRSVAATYEWAVHFGYAPEMALTFLDPYVFGSASDSSFSLPVIFWENYGYVGALTVGLAFVAVCARPSRLVLGVAGMTLVAFAMTLGDSLPLYRFAFEWLPGLARFRMPTRFLFVVDFGLVVLGGIGLTRLERWVGDHLEHPRREVVARLLAGAVVAYVAFDLVAANARQNPMVSSARWLAAPRTAMEVRRGGGGRVLSPAVLALHQATFDAARGWSGSLEPYIGLREALQPNSNLLHGVASAGGYSGIAPSWVVDLVGDHNRGGILDELHRVDATGFHAHPAYFEWVRALSIRWLVVPTPLRTDAVDHVLNAGPVALYRVNGALPRARLVHRTRFVADLADAVRTSLAGELDLAHEALVSDRRDLLPIASSSDSAESVRIERDRSGEVVVQIHSASDAMLVLADAYYPGWRATVDGRPARIARIDLGLRGVRVPAGDHHVRFRYEPSEQRLGGAISAVALVLALGLVALARILRRDR